MPEKLLFQQQVEPSTALLYQRVVMDLGLTYVVVGVAGETVDLDSGSSHEIKTGTILVRVMAPEEATEDNYNNFFNRASSLRQFIQRFNALEKNPSSLLLETGVLQKVTKDSTNKTFLIS